MTTERRALGPVGALMGPELGVLPAGRMSFPLESSVRALEMCFSMQAPETCFGVRALETCFSVCDVFQSHSNKGSCQFVALVSQLEY